MIHGDEEAIAQIAKWGTMCSFRFLGVYALADWFCFQPEPHHNLKSYLLQEIAGKNEYK
jgi:hypothetical protein